MIGRLMTLLSVLVFCVACGPQKNPKFEQAMDAYLQSWGELVELCEGFQNAQQIRDSAARVRSLTARMDSVEEDLEEAASRGIVREAREDPRVLELIGRYRAAMKRIHEDPEMAEALGELMGVVPPA